MPRCCGLWMFITGLGVGPTFAVFTLIVQNSVPVARARRGDQQPDVLPAGRRHGRPGHHRHDLRVDAARGGAAGSSRRPGCRPRSPVRSPASDALEQPDRRRRPGRGHPGAACRPRRQAARWSRSSRRSCDAIHEAFSIATAATFTVGIVTALAAALVILFVMPGGRMGQPVEDLEPALPMPEMNPAPH